MPKLTVAWWQRALNICREHGQSWLLRPNIFRLLASASEILAMALRDRLNVVISVTAVAAGKKGCGQRTVFGGHWPDPGRDRPGRVNRPNRGGTKAC